MRILNDYFERANIKVKKVNDRGEVVDFNEEDLDNIDDEIKQSQTLQNMEQESSQQQIATEKSRSGRVRKVPGVQNNEILKQLAEEDDSNFLDDDESEDESFKDDGKNGTGSADDSSGGEGEEDEADDIDDDDIDMNELKNLKGNKLMETKRQKK